MANKPQKATVRLPNELRDGISKGLKKHGKIKVVGLGIFELKKVKKRRGRNPATGDIMDMPAYQKIKYHPTAALKSAFK